MREKLIELLKQSPFLDVVKGYKTNPTFEEAADHLIANGVVVLPLGGIGEMSDGYHTFNELYHHRAMLFSVICNARPDLAWKSKLHDTGDMYEGMFIVGIETKEGQATYHYDIDPYWDMFNVPVLDRAPVWDGHTPQQAIDRIAYGVVISNSEITTDKDTNVPSNWIPVTERLPETIPCGAGTAYSEAVNVLTDGRKVLTAIWNGTHWICDAEFWDAEFEEITHWTPVFLPLPQPPKGE